MSQACSSVVKNWPSMCAALSLTLSTTNRKEEKHAITPFRNVYQAPHIVGTHNFFLKLNNWSLKD